MSSTGREHGADRLADRLLSELDRLADEDLFLLAELWSEEDADARRRAWQRAKTAIERARLTAVLERARLEVGRWMMTTTEDYHGIGGDLLGRVGEHASLRRHAAPAVLDALVALLAEHDLHSTDYDVLAGPWLKMRQVESELGTDIENDAAGQSEAKW